MPFALPTAGTRSIGVVDGIARLPLIGVVVVLFGKPRSASTWRGAGRLRVNMADLFGGHAFKSR
jgi:hypothetical protein